MRSRVTVMRSSEGKLGGQRDSNPCFSYAAFSPNLFRVCGLRSGQEPGRD
jgi:hypothetical protein